MPIYLLSFLFFSFSKMETIQSLSRDWKVNFLGIRKSIWRFENLKQFADVFRYGCPERLSGHRGANRSLGGPVVQEPASALAKSSSRSSLAPSLPSSFSVDYLPPSPSIGHPPSGVSDKPGPFSWTQRATRLVNERQTSTDDTSRDGRKSHSAH